MFGAPAASAPQVDVTPLHAKIGQLTLEKDFLEHALPNFWHDDGKLTMPNIVNLPMI